MSLGVIKDAFSPACKFHGVYLQIAHKGQNPKCPEPAFRLLRFVNSNEDSRAALPLLNSYVGATGNILLQPHNQPTLICTDLDRQTSADYVLPAIQRLQEEYLRYVRFLDEDFAENRRSRREGLQEEARARHQEYVKQYNQKGWVKFMRAVQNIHPDVQVVPGMHMEAEAQSQAKEKKEVALKPDFGIQDMKVQTTEPEAINETVQVERPGTVFHNADMIEQTYPDAARKKGQRYAAVSILMDDSDDMEVLLYVHAVYSDLKVAKEHVESELTELLQPLPIDVVDMYEWIFPVRMQWENSHMSQRVTELEETWGNQELGAAQMDRLEAVKKNRKLKHDIMKKKEMDAGVQAQIAEHLGVSAEDLLRILDNPAYGAEAVIKWVQNENVEERKAEAAQALK